VVGTSNDFVPRSDFLFEGIRLFAVVLQVVLPRVPQNGP